MIQIFRSDNTKEYTSHKVEDYFVRKGILHKTYSFTPPQNGVVEERTDTLR